MVLIVQAGRGGGKPDGRCRPFPGIWTVRPLFPNPAVELARRFGYNARPVYPATAE